MRKIIKLTREEKDYVIHLFKTEKENSIRKLAERTGYTEHVVNKVIDVYLYELMTKK